MKKWGAVIAAVVLLVGIGVAMAVGGSETDPLISKSYVEDTFLSNLAERLAKQASEASRDLYTAAVGKLDRLGEADVRQADAVKGGGYGSKTVRAGEVLTLKTGGSLVIYSGSGTLTTGTLADVTAGEAVKEGGVLRAGHRYIVTGPAGITVRFDTAAALGYQGDGELAAGQPGGDTLPFADVGRTDWFYDAVAFVYDRGYFAGTSATTFEPGTSMTRGMLATVLYRLSGSTDQAGESPFTDVSPESWYAAPVAWASANGVVNGMGGGRYEPDGLVTREQMVTMLYRFVTGYLKIECTHTDKTPGFPDWDQVSVWAADAMRWAVEQRLIQGRNTGELDPGGTATRAEVATILRRFADFLEKD